ncbi:MAG: restriction endonuclease [Nitrososphaerota archaeon]|nr:restriction endonuclease [Candidatus Bathyarchaeota archaeon]MDW8022796.1 restriction endonuclease [Nitrososphaerota archaeon]
MSGEGAKPKEQVDMKQLVIEYFKRKGYKVDESVSLEGFQGVSRNFDLIVQKGRVAQAVWVKDWKRTIGINIVINLDKASEEVGLPNPIIVGEKFSDHAKAYANRRKIMLLTTRQILQSLR